MWCFNLYKLNEVATASYSGMATKRNWTVYYYQIYCRPTYVYLEERLLPRHSIHGHRVWTQVGTRFALTTVYMFFITLVAAAMPFFGDFVSICGAVGFTPLDFVFPALAFTKAGKLPKKKGFSIFSQTLNLTIAILFSIVAVLGCTGAVRFIVEDIGTYKLFYNVQVFQRHKVVNV